MSAAGDAGRGVALVAAAACVRRRRPPAPTAGDDTAYVVATTGIWADIAGRVACDGSLDVRTIVPAGGDPHSFEPSLRDREVLDGATLVVANGLGLEETLDDTLDAGRGRRRARVPRRRPRRHDRVATATSADPHVWFDPTRVAAALPALGDGARRRRRRPGDDRRLRDERPRPTSPRSTRS